MHSLLASISRDCIEAQPFAHVHRHGTLPADVYANLSASFPSANIILGDRSAALGNAAARMSTLAVLQDRSISPDWRNVFALHTSTDFWADIVRVFGDEMRRRFPKLEERIGRPMADFRIGVRGTKTDIDLRLECQCVINTPGSKLSSVKTPHVDKRQTLFSGLFYMRDPDDDAAGGDLELYRSRCRPRFLTYRMILPCNVEPVRSVPYRENTLVCFVNSSHSVHGVSPRAPFSKPRRY